MAKNEARLLSGRIKTKTGDNLDSRRSAFLSLDNAEPNFGNPDSDRYILASLADGTRLFLKLNKGFLVSADSVSADESTFEIDPSGLANAAGTTLSEVLDQLDSAITLAFGSGVIHDDNFEGAGTVESPLALDSDLRIFGITGDSATFTNITSSGIINFFGATIIDAGTVNNIDINAGNIDNTDIATSNITVGATKTLDVSTGTLTLADDQISGDKVEGGTIDTITVNNLTSGNANIDGGFIDGTAIGHTTPDSASFTNISTSGAATLASASVTDLTNDRIVVAGTSGELEDDSNLTYDGSTLTVANSTTSTNSATGALVVTGGVGIGGALNVNGNTEIAGDLTVTGTTTTIEVQTLAIQDPLIHLADSNESADEVDIGFIGHYYDAALGGRQHTGLFRDATDDKYYLFAQYQDSALDSSPRSNTIDRSDPSFVLADLNAATVVADTFSGTVSADSIDTTKLTATNIVGGFIDGMAIGHTTADSGTFTNLARTSPAGVTAGTYGSVSTVPIVTVDASGFIDSIGVVGVSGILNTQAGVTTGSVNLLDSSLEIIEGEGINATASGNTITISGELADNDNKGIASFDGGDFNIDSGAVTIKTGGVGNDQLENDDVTVTAGSGLTGGGSVALGSSTELKLDSAAVKGLFSAGDNISYNSTTGEIAVAASGVVSGTYGSATKIPVITVDEFGQVDSVGLIPAQASLGDTVDSIFHNPITGQLRVVTDVASFFTDIVLDPYTTDSLSEGTTNLYYTKTRVDSDIDQAFNENPSFGGSGAPFTVSSDTLVTNLNADKLDGLSSESFLRSDSADIKTSGDLRFNDNVKLTFGASDDLRIYHDQTNSYIEEIGTGDFKLLTNGQSIILEDSTNEKVSGKFTPSTSVELYYAGNKKFETSATGVTVTGEVVADSATINGSLNLGDNNRIKLGDGADLQIYSNGTNSFITEGGTGDLVLQGANIRLENGSGEYYARMYNNNKVALYYDHAVKFETTDSGVLVTGSIRADSSTFTNITRTGATVVAGTYGSTTGIPVVTVDGSGFVDSIGLAALSTILSTTAETGTGSVNLLDSSLEIAAGVGIDTTASGNTVTVEIDSADLAAYFSKVINHDSTSGFVADEHVAHSDIEINAGKGLTGGGNIASDVTLDIDSANVRGMFSGGTGITYNSGTGEFTTTDGEIVHDNLSGFIANEHIDHSTVTITAGDGLTGGGDITSSRTLNVVGGDGITANADEIEVTVDGSTIELSASNGTGAVRVKDGGITNAKLANNSVTIGSTEIALGATSTTLDELTQIDVDNVRILDNTVGTTSGNLILDPAPLDDSTGTVVILGDLQVDGTTTTINSTTVTISDKNIVLADSATTPAQANGAGITVNGGNATITYDGTADRWDFNKPIEVSTVHGALSGNVTSSSVDIDGGFIDGTAIGHTTPDSGTFTNLTSNGNTTLGDASGDTVTFNAGAWTLSNNVTVTGTWADLGTVTTVDINGGSIDGATIATSDITVGASKTLDVSAGTLTLANDQISGDKVEGGTIDTVTVNNLTSGNVDINGGNIDGTTIATSDITVGTGKTIDVSGGTLTLANDQISGDKIDGGTIGTVTITNLTSGNVDINGGNIDGTNIGSTTPDSGTFTGITVNNNIAVNGTVDGRDVAADGATLDSATASNTPHAIVLRDGSGNFSAGTITAALSGNASTASALASSQNFSLTGDVTATAVGFDGSGAVQLTTVYNPGSIVNEDINASAAIADTKLATISATGKVSNSATTATDANTINAIVARDGSGNFSAGTITATLSGNASTATTATIANNVAITDDTSDNSTHYVHFGDATSGYNNVQVSSSKLTFNPSSGTLQVGGLTVATTADLTAASSPNFSVDSANFGTANSFTIGEGKAVYYDTTTSKWEGAYNDSAGEYNASHVIVDMTSTDVKIASSGIFTIGMSGMSANNYYFLSSTAGTTTNDPDSSPTIFQPLYYALDANTIDLNIQAAQDTVITTWPVGQNPGEETHGGTIVYSGIPSDERLKENIEAIQLNALDTVDELNPVSFDFKDPINRYQEGQQLGFIAQQILEVIPQSVYTDSSDSDATLILKPEAITPVLVKAIQELSGKVTELSAKVTSLEKEIEHMKPPVRKRRLR